MAEFIYVDPDDGMTYEMNYVVTQSDDEGPEYVEWRISPRNAGSRFMDTSWHRLPPWATPPQEAMEHWHGPTFEQTRGDDEATANRKGLLADDFNDLVGAVYRLTTDLKGLELLPPEFHYES